MENITECLNGIDNSVYGKDMRKYIHGGIKLCYDDAIANGHTDMEVVKARGSYNDLNARLEADKTERIEAINTEAENRKNTDENLQSQINGLASGSPLAANSVSEMTDTSRVYVNIADGHWYTYNGTSWIDGGVYQATQIANKSISPEKTNFIEKVESINKINLSDNWNLNKIYNSTIGSVPGLVNTEGYVASDLLDIPEVLSIKSNTQFYIYFFNNNQLISRISSGWSNFTLENIEIPDGATRYSTAFFINNTVTDDEKIVLWKERVNNNSIMIVYLNSFSKINNDLEGKIIIPDLYIEDLENCKKNIENINKNQNQLITNNGTTYAFDFSSISNSIVIKDTNIRKINNTSRATFNNSGTSLIKQILSESASMSESITLCFYIDNESYNNLQKLDIYLGKDLTNSNYTSGSKREIWKTGFKVGWNFTKILKSQFSNNSTLSNFNSIYIEAITALTEENLNFTTINFDCFIIDMKIKPIILLCLDGIVQGSIDNGLYNYIFSKNLPYTVFARNHNTYDTNLINVMKKGSQHYRWELGLYGSYGNDNTVVQNGTDYRTIKSNIENNKNALLNTLNINPKSYACSQGKINPLIISACLDNNIQFVRGGGEQYIDFVDKDIHQINHYLIDNTKTLITMKGYIDTAIEYGRIVCLLTHGTTDEGQASLYAKDTDYRELLDYIYEKREAGEIEVLTFNELYNRYVK